MRSRTMLVLLSLIGLWASAALAQQPTPRPGWAHGTEEFVLSGSATKNQLTGHMDTDLTGAWLHYASDRSEIGVATSLSRRGAEGGQGAGPAYEWNLPRMRKGQFFLGGDAQILTGEESDFAKAKAATRFGYKLFVGNSSALRVALDVVRAVNADSAAAADKINQIGLTFGFSMGVSPGTPIR